MTETMQVPNPTPFQPAAEREYSAPEGVQRLAHDSANDDLGPDDRPPSPTAPGARGPVPVAMQTVAVGYPQADSPPVGRAPTAGVHAAGEVVLLKSGGPLATLAIIGGGPAGVSAVEALLQLPPALRDALEVYIVDDAGREDLGRGAPFRQAPGVAGDFLYMNMFTVSVQLNKRTGIVRDLLADLGTVPISDFMKRCDVGEVLARRATRILGEAEAAGMPIHCVQGRAFDIIPGREAGATVYVRRPDGQKVVIAAQLVILTIGNEASSRYEKLEGPGFIGNAWSEVCGIHHIPKDARVAIAGTSLASMDVASVLQAQSHLGAVLMFSPSAKLPGIRPLHASTSLRVLAPEHLDSVLPGESLPLSFDAVLRLVKREFEAQGQDWSLVEARLADYVTMEPLE
jgi:uncharacterized NAD(P)/FAD-binding protein YdhS